jgi:hypothetical protein
MSRLITFLKNRISFNSPRPFLKKGKQRRPSFGILKVPFVFFFRRAAGNRTSLAGLLAPWTPLGFQCLPTRGNSRFPDPFPVRFPAFLLKSKTASRSFLIFVGLPGIEPGLYAPEAHVLPVYYSPNGNSSIEAQKKYSVYFFLLR